eukprot:750437-Hanusia_phi.AAC.3
MMFELIDAWDQGLLVKDPQRRLTWPRLAEHAFILTKGEANCIDLNNQLPAPRQSIAQQFTKVASQSSESLHGGEDSKTDTSMTQNKRLSMIDKKQPKFLPPNNRVDSPHDEFSFAPQGQKMNISSRTPGRAALNNTVDEDKTGKSPKMRTPASKRDASPVSKYISTPNCEKSDRDASPSRRNQQDHNQSPKISPGIGRGLGGIPVHRGDARAKTQPGKQRQRPSGGAKIGFEDVSSTPQQTAGQAATMSRTDNVTSARPKAQPLVRRAGPAPTPGGDEWWQEVETISKTTQGTAKLLRDKLFHEKLLMIMDTIAQAPSFDHSMLKRLGAALKTMNNIFTYTMQSTGSPRAPANSAKLFPILEVVKKLFSLLYLFLGTEILQHMGTLSTKPPSKLAAELCRVMNLALRKSILETEFVQEDMYQHVAELLPLAFSSTMETGAVIRASFMDILGFLGQHSGSNPWKNSNFYKMLVKRSIVSPIVSILAAAQLSEKTHAHDTHAAVQCLADIVCANCEYVSTFPGVEQGSSSVTAGDGGGEDEPAGSSSAMEAASVVFELLWESPSSLLNLVQCAEVGCCQTSAAPQVNKECESNAMKLLLAHSMSSLCRQSKLVEPNVCGEVGKRLVLLGLSRNVAKAGMAADGQESLLEVRALICASRFLSMDHKTAQAILTYDTKLLTSLSARLCSAPDRAVRFAAAAAIASVLSSSEPSSFVQSQVAASLAEVVEETGIAAIEQVFAKSSSYNLQRAEGCCFGYARSGGLDSMIALLFQLTRILGANFSNRVLLVISHVLPFPISLPFSCPHHYTSCFLPAPAPACLTIPLSCISCMLLPPSP